jgi:hypothetical protein
VPLYVTIDSGKGVSSGFGLERAELSMAIEVPSHSNAWGLVQVQFSGVGTGGPYGAMWVAGATSAYVWAGAGPGFGDIPRVATPWGRIAVTNSTTTVMTFTLHQNRNVS